MNWQERNVWLALAAVVALIAWQMTRWITHVDHTPAPTIALTFNQPRSLKFKRPVTLTLASLQNARQQFPGAAMTSPSSILFALTPSTQSIELGGSNSRDISCSSVDVRHGGLTALLAGSGKGDALEKISVEQSDRKIFVPIPRRLSLALQKVPNGQGAIECKSSRPLSTAPTFTERAVTVQADTRSGGGVIVDVSALQDVDDLRFSGGMQLPLGGDRVRLLYGNNDIVSAEWTDVAAQEQRDIVLVLIGALSAIAAAMVIEAIRPSVQSKSKPD